MYVFLQKTLLFPALLVIPKESVYSIHDLHRFLRNDKQRRGGMWFPSEIAKPNLVVSQINYGKYSSANLTQELDAGFHI